MGHAEQVTHVHVVEVDSDDAEGLGFWGFHGGLDQVPDSA
jgi:hypothetical protein